MNHRRTNTHPRTAAPALALALLALPGLGMAATRLECPPTVQLSSASAEAGGLPAGAALSLTRSPMRLSGIGMYDGPPEQGAALMPQSDKARKAGSTTLWAFEGDYPQGRFASCDYAGGAVRVVLRIDDAAKACTATTQDNRAQRTLAARFQCE